jgi:hypothetical protein
LFIGAALGHRVPGMFPFDGGISDYRMYVGEALRYAEDFSCGALVNRLIE